MISKPKYETKPQAQSPNTRLGRAYTLAIGIGIALFPVHNKWLTDITAINGMATAFIPAFAAVLWILGTLLFLRDNWKSVTVGEYKIAIPLAVIVLAIAVSGLSADSIGNKLAPLFTGIVLFGLYLAARLLGKDVFMPLAVGSALASLGILVYSLLHPGVTTGGFVFEKNFDIATGYVLLGAALFTSKHRWVLAGLATVSLSLSGAPEAVFAIGMVFLVMLLRKDYSRRLVVIGAGILCVLLLGLVFGWTQSLYQYTLDTINGEHIANYTKTETVSPLEIRYMVIRDALADIKPLGKGYNLTVFSVETVHNVPIIMIQQLGWLGILAGISWLWISGWCLFKSKYKYAWVLVLALGMVDHYFWDQMAPVWPALVGISTIIEPAVKSDLVFKR